jgi:hypothetical protein
MKTTEETKTKPERFYLTIDIAGNMSLQPSIEEPTESELKTTAGREKMDNSIECLRAYVGYSLEYLPSPIKGTALIVDGDGRDKRLSCNFTATIALNRFIVGDIVIAKVREPRTGGFTKEESETLFENVKALPGFKALEAILEKNKRNRMGALEKALNSACKAIYDAERNAYKNTIEQLKARGVNVI